MLSNDTLTTFVQEKLDAETDLEALQLELEFVDNSLTQQVHVGWPFLFEPNGIRGGVGEGSRDSTLGVA